MQPFDEKAPRPVPALAEQDGTTLVRLVGVMRRLLAPNGCPWDREQTHASLRPFVLEETYEVLEAIEAGDRDDLREELGDYLYEAVFLAQISEEQGDFSIGDAIDAIRDKLVRRHPHVFGDVEARTADRVRSNWERIKREQEGREGIFHDVGEGLPGLLFARKVQQRAKAVGFEYPDLAGAMADLADELRELEEEPSGNELGDVLFAAVNVARRLEVDPELEVRQAAKRFRRRIEIAEKLAAGDGKDWTTLPLDEQDAYFDRAKEAE